jgi:hypothetical protein
VLLEEDDLVFPLFVWVPVLPFVDFGLGDFFQDLPLGFLDNPFKLSLDVSLDQVGLLFEL